MKLAESVTLKKYSDHHAKSLPYSNLNHFFYFQSGDISWNILDLLTEKTLLTYPISIYTVFLPNSSQ